MKKQDKKEKVFKLSNLENLPKEIEKFLKEHSEYHIKKYLITIETSKGPEKITIVSLSPTLDVFSSIIKNDFSAVIEQLKKDPLSKPKPMPELSGHFGVEGNISRKEIFQAIKGIEHITVQDSLEKLKGISKEELTMDMLLDYLLVTE